MDSQQQVEKGFKQASTEKRGKRRKEVQGQAE